MADVFKQGKTVEEIDFSAGTFDASGRKLTPASAGGVATDSIFTAKGDLPAGTGAGTAAALTVGVNDYVLTADSSKSTGLKWAPAATTGAPTDATYITQTPNGTLSAEQALSALGTGLVKNTTGTGVLSIAVAGTDYQAPLLTDGWTAAEETWTYASADGPTGTFTIAGVDLTTKYAVGQRIKLSQTTTKYFIVTAVSFSTDTTVTVYGGTDYTLANAAITSPFWSMHKAPFGFPLDPAKWTETFSDANQRTQATPTAGTWYNVGTSTLSIPIGCWNVEYEVNAGMACSSNNPRAGLVTLSTANNSESDVTMSCSVYGYFASDSYVPPCYRHRFLTLAAKTSYYLNIKLISANTGVSSLKYEGGSVGGATIIRAICAYL